MFDKDKNESVVEKKIKHGGKMNLNCESDENPEATANWFFGSKSQYDVKHFDNSLKTWILEDMKISMKGFYKCVIENSVGKATKYFTVIYDSIGNLRKLSL